MGLRMEQGALEQVRLGVAVEVGNYCLDKSQNGSIRQSTLAQVGRDELTSSPQPRKSS